MFAWWQSLTVTELIFAYVAIPSTLLLVIQTVLLLLGLGDHDSDTDFDAHGHDFDFDHDGHVDLTDGHDGVFGEDHPDSVFHGDSGLRLFTLRGIVAFFAVLGWTGLTLLRQGLSAAVSVAVALCAGLLALFAVALVMRWFYRSQNSGNMEMKNALGVSGTVYITVPPAREGQGKVNLMLQSQYSELSAVTDHETALVTGTEVTVVGISGVNTLVVKPK